MLKNGEVYKEFAQWWQHWEGANKLDNKQKDLVWWGWCSCYYEMMNKPKEDIPK